MRYALPMASGRLIVAAIIAGATLSALRAARQRKCGDAATTCTARMAVFYDGGCGFCVPIVSRLRRLDTRHRVTFRDVVGEWDRIHADHPTLDRDAVLVEMHGITPDGRVVRGFDTYRELAWLMPAAWPLVPFLYLPPIPQIGRRVARAIADRRHAAGCALPQRDE